MVQNNSQERVTAELRALAGANEPGTRLPSVRELTASHKVSPVTVQSAISALVAEGLIDAKPGRGTFVAAKPEPLPNTAAPDFSWQQLALGRRVIDDGHLSELISVPEPGAAVLSTGYLETSLQPTAALASAMVRAARRHGAWERLPVEGLPELREWFAREAGGLLRGNDFVICSGGQSGISTILRAFASPGDPVIVESPTYLGVLSVIRAAGLVPIPVPSDKDGIRPDLLASALRRSSSRLVYLQPLYANPHGATLPPQRRAEVMQAIIEAGAFIVEDDAARDLPIDGNPEPPMVADDPDGHVIYLRALTKGTVPSMRLSGVAARGAAGSRLKAARTVDDFFVAGPMQLAALEFLSSPAWRRHLKALRSGLRLRRDALLAEVRSQLGACEVDHVPRGGLHLAVRLPEQIDDVRLAADARAAGILVSPLTPLYAGESPSPGLRLTFGGAGPTEFAASVGRLAELDLRLR